MPSNKNSYLFYPITVIKNKFFTKQELVDVLEKNGIETRPVMAGNMINQPVSKYIKYKKTGNLKNSNYIQKNSFLIGNHHKINEKQKKFIVDVITNHISKSINN